MSGNGKTIKIIAITVLCAAIVGLGAASSRYVFKLVKYGFRAAYNHSSTTNPTGEAIKIPTGEATNVSAADVSTLANNIMPAVVSIECKVTTTTTDLFGRTYEREGQAAGSGFIISQQNDTLYIATNEHVVSGAKEIQVYFTDGTSAKATVKGSDVNADLAVICVSMKSLSQSTRSYIRIATIGDSTQLKAGDFVVAVGNALGTGQSVTVGYVSALEREVTIDEITRTLLQTDAAINPGNSGGALLNQNGEVIGINSAKYASETVEGTGFAIPMADAVPILMELMNREAISEKDAGFLGIQGKTVTTSYSQRFGIPVGVYVSSVKSGSPAEKAGLREGDIIVAYNGAKVSTNEDLQVHLDSTRAGVTIKLTVSSLEKNEYVEREVEVTLDRR